MKTIYTYLDYREYLRDFYEFRKKENTSFSMRLFGRMVHIDASYLNKVLNGTRHITEESLQNLIPFLKLNTEQAEYFKNLLWFSKARKDEEKRIFFEKLLSMRRRRTACLDEYQYNFYQKWYYSALRNLLEFYPFSENGNYSKLGAELSPPITAAEAREGISLLKKLNLIIADEKGIFKLTDKAISSGETWQSLAITGFQEKTIQLSQESLKRHAKEERDISSITMNITQKEFEQIRAMIKNFRSSVIDYVDSAQDPDRVFQLNIQMIPLSKPVKIQN